MPSSKAVITGLGIVSSIGIGCEDYFDALLQQRSGIRSLSERTDGGAVPSTSPSEPDDLAELWIGAPILDFDPKQYVRPRKALKVMCREIQTAFAASVMAIEQSGLDSALPASDDADITPDRIGTVLGSEMFFGPPQDMSEPMTQCIDADGTFNGSRFGSVTRRGIMPLWMLKYLPNMPSCQIGIAVNAHGPNNSLVEGDVSGPAALIEAVSYIRRGLCDIVISGATGTMVDSTRLVYRNDLPRPAIADPVSSSSRPHDLTSKGVVGGEGAVSIVVEQADHAASRGSTVIAEIAACVSRFAAAKVMTDSPRQSSANGHVGRGSSAAIELAINAALQQADLSPSQIGLVVSHGSGDREVDAAEKSALANTIESVPMITPMSLIGHCGAASGAIGIVTGALVLKNRSYPSGDSRAKLTQDYVICLAHTPEGNATAVILKSPAQS